MRQRDLRLDMIRIFALFSVISVHFFLNNGFYEQPVIGTRMLIMCIMRCFFMICVPLFMMLTGYLMSNKTLSKKYYFGITKTIVIYILASISCLIFKQVYFKEKYTLFQMLLMICDFSAANYSWYIEMYIGLFMLIPFLNILMSRLDKSGKKKLILTLILMTSLPNMFNIWKNTMDAYDFQKIIPSYWTILYPITYYYIGSFIKKSEMKINTITGIFSVITISSFLGLFCYFRSLNNVFIWGPWCDFNSPFVLLLTAIIFLLFLNMKVQDKMTVSYKKMIKVISDSVLGAYLVSYIFDSIFYPILIQRTPIMTDRLNYYFIIVPTVLVCSIILSFLLNLIYFFIKKIVCTTMTFCIKHSVRSNK